MVRQARHRDLSLTKSPINFDALLREVCEGLFFLNQSEKIPVNYSSSCNGSFFTNEKLLNIILTSLIAAGIKKNTDSVSAIDIVVVSDNSKAVITIKHTGYCFDDDDMASLFDLDIKTDLHENLYVAAESLKRLNGKILIEYVQGHGTEFSLEIPNLLQDSSVRGNSVLSHQTHFE